MVGIAALQHILVFCSSPLTTAGGGIYTAVSTHKLHRFKYVRWLADWVSLAFLFVVVLKLSETQYLLIIADSRHNNTKIESLFLI